MLLVRVCEAWADHFVVPLGVTEEKKRSENGKKIVDCFGEEVNLLKILIVCDFGSFCICFDISCKNSISLNCRYV